MWKIEIMTILFSLERQEETWVEHQTRTSIMARKFWVKMKLPFLYAELRNVFGALWSGLAMKKRMR